MKSLLGTLTVLVVVLASSIVAAEEDTDYTLVLSDEDGVLGGTADVTVTLDFLTGDDVQGYSFGVCHDDGAVTLEAGDVVKGAGLDGVSFTFEFIDVLTDPGDSGFIVAGLLDVIGEEVLEPADDLELFVATYALDTPGLTILEWCETLGDPAVSVSIIADGAEIEPAQDNGSINIAAPVPVCSTDPDELWPPDHELTDVVVEITFEEGDPDSVDLDSVLVVSDEPDNGQADGNTTGDVNGEDGFTAPVDVTELFEFDPEVGDGGGFVGTIPLRAERSARGDGRTYSVEVTVSADGSTTTTSCAVAVPHDQRGNEEDGVTNAEGDDTEGVQYEGTVTLTAVDGAREFRRGDVSANGTTFALLDALFLLEWAFVGGAVPPCMDAADVDGNNDVFPLIDALRLLLWAFVGGAVPPDPGPFSCGPDNDDDGGDDEDTEATTNPPNCLEYNGCP